MPALRRALALSAIAVNTLAAVATSHLMLSHSSGDPSGYVLWALAPSVAMLLISVAASLRLMDAAAALVGSLAVSGFGAYLIYDALCIHPDPQSGLVAIVLPAVQLWGAGLTVAVILALRFGQWLLWPEPPNNA